VRICTKSQVSWLNLPHLPMPPPPVTAKQRVVIIEGDRPEDVIDETAVEGKTLRQGQF